MQRSRIENTQSTKAPRERQDKGREEARCLIARSCRLCTSLDENRAISRKITRYVRERWSRMCAFVWGEIRKPGNNSRCHDIAGILEGRRYEARRNTYIYLRFRPLANKRRLGRGKERGVCAPSSVYLRNRSAACVKIEARKVSAIGAEAERRGIIIFRYNGELFSLSLSLSLCERESLIRFFLWSR